MESPRVLIVLLKTPVLSILHDHEVVLIGDVFRCISAIAEGVLEGVRLDNAIEAIQLRTHQSVFFLKKGLEFVGFMRFAFFYYQRGS